MKSEIHNKVMLRITIVLLLLTTIAILYIISNTKKNVSENKNKISNTTYQTLIVPCDTELLAIVVHKDGVIGESYSSLQNVNIIVGKDNLYKKDYKCYCREIILNELQLFKDKRILINIYDDYNSYQFY